MRSLRYRRRHVFELLMSFFHSEHADGYTCKLVLSFVQKCTRLPEFFALLLERHALVPWLASAVTAVRTLSDSPSVVRRIR